MTGVYSSSTQHLWPFNFPLWMVTAKPCQLPIDKYFCLASCPFLIGQEKNSTCTWSLLSPTYLIINNHPQAATLSVSLLALLQPWRSLLQSRLLSVSSLRKMHSLPIPIRIRSSILDAGLSLLSTNYRSASEFSLQFCFLHLLF